MEAYHARIGKMVVDLFNELNKQPPQETYDSLVTWTEQALEKYGRPIKLSALGARMPPTLRDVLYDEDLSLKRFLSDESDLFVVTDTAPGQEEVYLVGQEPPEAKPKACRFFKTTKGCKWGNDCRMQHGE
jgi:hypothetical protein